MAHHPLRDGETYEDLISDRELERIGRKRWRKRMKLVIATLEPVFNYDLLHIGGGNARLLEEPLPPNVRVFANTEGMTGGIRLWNDDPP
jgi:polyphosphate glucokinase